MNPIYNENPFFNINESTTDDEIIDIALNYMAKNPFFSFQDYIDNQFIHQKIERLEFELENSNIAKPESSKGISFKNYLISDFGKEIYHKHSGWLNFIKQSEISKKEIAIKDGLELENLKLSNENLKYQNEIKDLNISNLNLSIQNAKLDKKLKIYAILIIVIPSALWVFDHFELIKTTLRYISIAFHR